MNLISCIDANILLEASRVYALINFNTRSSVETYLH